MNNLDIKTQKRCLKLEEITKQYLNAKKIIRWTDITCTMAKRKV